MKNLSMTKTPMPLRKPEQILQLTRQARPLHPTHPLPHCRSAPLFHRLQVLPHPLLKGMENLF